LIKRSRVIIVAWLTLLVICAVLASRARVTSDFTAFLPEKLDAGQALLVHQLRDGVAARLMLIGISGGDEIARADASRALAAALAALPEFAYANNGESRYGAPDREFVMRQRYLLSPSIAPERFTTNGLRDTLQAAVQMLGSPLGGMLSASLPSDPTGEARRFFETLPGGATEMRQGVWFSPDGSRALLVAETRDAASEIDGQQRALAALRAAFAAAAPGGSLTLTVTGPGAFAVESRALIQTDASRLSGIAGALVIAILLYVYRSVLLTLSCFVPIASGMLAGVAVVSMLFGSIHGITLGFAAILFGEAVDYPSYLLVQNRPGESLSGTLARIGPTLRLAVLTTVLGGLSMLLSSFSGLAQLGLLLMTGVLVAGLVTRYVLPAVLSARPVAMERIAPLLGWTVVARWGRPVRWIAWGAAAVAVATLLQRADKQWDDDLGNLNPVPEAARQMDQRLRAELKAPDVRNVIVIRASDQETALEQSERLSDLLRGFKEQKLITAFEMASQYLPSQKRQREQQSALPDARALRSALSEAAVGLPFKPGLFEPFLRDVEAARNGPLLERAAFKGTGLQLKLDSLLFQINGGWIALIPLQGVTDAPLLAQRFATLKQEIAASTRPNPAAEVSFFDLRGEASHMIQRYRNESMRFTALGIGAMLLLLLWGLGGIGEALRVILPVLLAVLIEAALLPLTGNPMTIFHLVSLLFVIGTGLNYSLFFHCVPRDRDERDRTLLSVTVCSLATLCSAGALVVSATPVLHAIGMTVLIGTPLTLLLSAAFGKDAAALNARQD
jgi:predicted exporter